VDEAVEFATSRLWSRAGHFVYCEGSDAAIHNANLLVASFVGRATRLGSPERELATRAVMYTVDRQRDDGSWPYGEGRRLDWVDGFHTAYVLERLAQWHDLEPDCNVATALDRGTSFYIDRLLDADGAARASSTSRFPLETHAAASAVTALTRLGEHHPGATASEGKVLAWALANLRRHDDRFVFRRGRFVVNRTPYIRWSDCHMLLALANHLGRRA
jgi:hypothetical protein